MQNESQQQYKYFRIVENRPGGVIDCYLTKPIPLDSNFFIDAFWMPIKKQLGKKVVFLPNGDRHHFELCYAQNCAIGDVKVLTKEQVDFIAEDAPKTIGKALYHIDKIMDHIYYTEDHFYPDTARFATCPGIVKVDDTSITMNGRLPMQEEYFVKRYWQPLAQEYHSNFKGIGFKICFDGPVVAVVAEHHARNALMKKLNREHLGWTNEELLRPIVQQLVSDLVWCVDSAIMEYWTAYDVDMLD